MHAVEPDATVPVGAVVELPTIPEFAATHDPDIEPDYVNLPRGIEAVDLARTGENHDYINLGVAGMSPHVHVSDLMTASAILTLCAFSYCTFPNARRCSSLTLVLVLGLVRDFCLRPGLDSERE